MYNTIVYEPFNGYNDRITIKPLSDVPGAGEAIVHPQW